MYCIKFEISYMWTDFPRLQQTYIKIPETPILDYEFSLREYDSSNRYFIWLIKYQSENGKPVLKKKIKSLRNEKHHTKLLQKRNWSTGRFLKKGFGDTNDDNTPRRFFADTETSALFTELDKDLIRKGEIVLEAPSMMSKKCIQSILC